MTLVETGTAASPSFDLLRMDRQIQRRETARRLAKLIGWTGMVALAVRRGGALGWLVAGGGVYGLVNEVLDYRDSRPEWKKEHVGRTSRGFLGRLLARHEDRVDRQSQLSFPASDAPARAPE